MVDFVFTSILWILALYGFFEIIKNIIYIHKLPNVSFNGTSFIITVHNQENSIEYFLKLFIYKILYYNINFPDIVIVDLNSTDKTLEILNKFSRDFSFIKVLTFDEYKDIIFTTN